jgi:hypothetical protein
MGDFIMMVSSDTAAKPMPVTPGSLGILDFEVVMAEFGFYLSVAGFVELTECLGYSINESGHIVLRQRQGEVVLQQVPEMFVELIEKQESIIFARYENGDLVDAEELIREF